MSAAITFILRRWPIIALVLSAAMLAIAHGFQTFGHLAPCTLCLKQREVYWVALGVAAVGSLAGFAPVGRAPARLACGALALVFLVGAGIAAYHAGAEWKWWPGPSTCSGVGGGVTAESLAALLHGAKVSAPRCDQAAWVWLGLSMAGWNGLISVALGAVSAAAALRSPPHD
jgi:disulfide bond formation protein DsbB